MECAETVGAGVGVEVGVKTGRDGNTKGVGGGDSGGPERALGGDVDQIRAIGAPCAAQRGTGGQTEAEKRITGNGHSRHRHHAVLRVVAGGRKIIPAGPVNGDGVTPAAELAGDHPERHRHAVHFGREGFGDEGEFHVFDDSRRGRLVSNFVNKYPSSVSDSWRLRYESAKTRESVRGVNS